jgi:hypothetical protein
MFGGADGSLLRYAVDQGAKGIVVQAVGMGNMNVSMFEAVKYALRRRVCFSCSCCIAASAARRSFKPPSTAREFPAFSPCELARRPRRPAVGRL